MTERSWKKRPKKLGKLDENKEFFQEKAVNSLLYSIAVSYGESNPMEKIFLNLYVNLRSKNLP